MGTYRNSGKGALAVGFPRAMLYYRYGVLWDAFFTGLGIKGMASRPTTKGLLEDGAALTPDESCLSAKIFMGHVKSLVGKCDYILVPRVSNFGLRRNMCTRYEALYDMTVNIFRDSGQRFLSYNIDANHWRGEEGAFLEMGMSLGFGRKQVRRAYKEAKKAEAAAWKRKVKKQEELYKTPGLKILLAAHSYVVEDAYIGKPVRELLEQMGAVVLRADLVNRKEALEQSLKISPTLKWELNREIAGGIRMSRGQADGIVFLSVFPCGPDSMVNELLMRRVGRTPALNLVLDGQDGLAGTETRLESFLDIIQFNRDR